MSVVAAVQSAAPTAQSELQRLSREPGVDGVVCVDRRDLSIVQSTLEQARTEALATTLLAVVALLDEQLAAEQDSTQFVRIRTRKHEILAAPHGHFVLITLANVASKPSSQ